MTVESDYIICHIHYQ